MCLLTSETELELNHSIVSRKLPEIKCERNHVELWVGFLHRIALHCKHWMLLLAMAMKVKMVKYTLIKKDGCREGIPAAFSLV